MSFDPVQAHLDIADRLRGHSTLADVEVVTEQPRTLDGGSLLVNPVEIAFSAVSNKGAALLVLLPNIGGGVTGDPDHFEAVTFEVVAMTSDLTSATAGGAGLRAADIAKRAAQCLRDFAAPGRFHKLEITGLEPFRNESLPEEIAEVLRGQRLSMWVVRITTQMELESLSKVADPTASETGGAVTLTCSTSGAAIYYTTDGGYPGSGNTTATLYAGAFNLSQSCTLRFAAQKSGLQASDVQEAVFTA